MSIKHTWLVIMILNIHYSYTAHKDPLIGFSPLYGYMTQKRFEEMSLYSSEKRDIFLAGVVALQLHRRLAVSEKKLDAVLTGQEKNNLEKLFQPQKSLQKIVILCDQPVVREPMKTIPEESPLEHKTDRAPVIITDVKQFDFSK